MTVQFETVLYGTGKIKRDSPAGFATIHYDTTPGPLSIFGGGNNSILGPGGIIPGIGEVLGGSGDASPLGLFKTARGAAAIFKNAKNVSKASILSEGYGILDKVARTGKLPDVLTGNSPAGLSLATLPGESPTSAIPRSQQAGGDGFNLGGLAAGIGGAVSGVTDKIGKALKGLLPSSASGSTTAIANARAEKAALASDISSQIEKNRGLKEELDARIAAADGDAEAVERIYSEFDALDYTDPDKLQSSLDSIALEDAELEALMAEAEASESPDTTLSSETTELTDEETAALFSDAEDVDQTETEVYTIPEDDEDSTTTYFA
jgi:hypothetical protein